MTTTEQWSNIFKGYSQVKLSSWKDFSDFVQTEMLDFEEYIWRGQRCDNWGLDSTLDRLIKNAKISKSNRLNFREKHLEKFKDAVRGRRGLNPRALNDEDEWWALGQHHGLCTPLLDWTTSPYVAAYFAYIGQSASGEKQTEFRAIYALHKPTIEEYATKLLAEEEKVRISKLADIRNKNEGGLGLISKMLLEIPSELGIKFIRPHSDENQRLVNQSGLFTRARYGKSIESWIEELNEDNIQNTLIKILVPNKERTQCLKTLNRMNINHLTLFPDLYGASKFCNLFGEIEKY